MFRSETVIDGDNESRKLAGEPTTNGVVCVGGGTEADEAASMKENDDGKEETGGEGGREEAKPEIAGSIEGGVRGGDRVGGFGVRGGLEVEEAEEAAVDGAIGAAGRIIEGGD